MRFTLAATPWRVRCSLILAPSTSSLLRSSATMTMSTALARSSNGMASPMARAAVRPPSQHASTQACERHAALLDIGHDDHRTPGFEQRRLDHQIVGCRALALRLTDHGEIEAARDLGEHRGCAAERRVEDTRFRRNSRLFRPRLEPADRVIGELAVFLALKLDQVDGNAPERAVWNHRLAAEGAYWQEVRE